MSAKNLRIQDYTYELPDERIARYPLDERDAARLLHYRQGRIENRRFAELDELLPAGTLLVFNNTRVIHARIRMSLPGGKPLEVFCLDPLDPVDYQQNFSSYGPVRWKALIGGNRRWKSGEHVHTFETFRGPVELTVKRIDRYEDAFTVEFDWDDKRFSFGELLTYGGVIPLPPYLNRDSEQSDADRYQTVYARHEGSVAAPTAGLHFTERLMQRLDDKGIGRAELTLHVGAGTFKPVSSPTLGEHGMHGERLFLPRTFLQRLYEQLRDGHPVVSVGTTSMRTLESLYWFGSRLHESPAGPADARMQVAQWEPYEYPSALPAADALQAILRYMDANEMEELRGETHILLAPGYRYRIVNGLITNFHQPQSTLLLLVAAFIGDDWRRVYDFALDNDFRFLSYGDSNLLWRS